MDTVWLVGVSTEKKLRKEDSKDFYDYAEAVSLEYQMLNELEKVSKNQVKLGELYLYI